MRAFPIVLGIDLATSAARVVAIDGTGGRVLGFVGAPLAAPQRQDAGSSRQRPTYLPVVCDLLGRTAELLGERASDVAALAVSGTSGSLVPCDSAGIPVGDTVLYDDAGAHQAALLLRQNGFGAGPGSVTARLGMLRAATRAAIFLHTPDVVLAGLAGRILPTDTSHALKAGIDPVNRRWPAAALAVVGIDESMLPALVHPGVRIGELQTDLAARCGLPAGVQLVSGMTDGCTAQIACGAVAVGDSVGVLGSTLVLKGVSVSPINSADGAVYSHYGPDGRWWPGAASNIGAGILAATIPMAELPALDAAAAARGPSSVLKYPLAGAGERFPIAGTTVTGWQLGKPVDAADAHRAILEGVAFTERFGLERLAAMGMSATSHRLTGGGTRSSVWNRIRATVIGQPVLLPPAAGSGHGAAALAASVVLTEPVARTVARWGSGAGTVLDPLPAEQQQLDDSYHRWSAELRRRADLVAAPC